MCEITRCDFVKFMQVCLTGCVLLASGLTAEETQYFWQKPNAKVLLHGDLEWAPEPFDFVTGDSIRYIDFENGSDDNDGLSKTTPWKHHPWDENAVGTAKSGDGIHSYVFKRGVYYRGRLESTMSGEEGNPIRLTSDPSWGEGSAYLVGSMRLTNGWQQCTTAMTSGIPEPEKVWYIDLYDLDGIDVGTPIDDREGISDSKLVQGVVPQNMWLIDGETVTRIPVCRHPNWSEETSHPDDPHTQWFEWEIRKDGINIDTKNLGGFAEDFFDGGIAHTENYVPPFGNMGTETSHRIEEYNQERKGLVFQATYLKRGNRYFLENIPGFLDEPGEFYCAQEFSSRTKRLRNTAGQPFLLSPKNIKPGRLFVRLPNDENPNDAIVEIAVRSGILKILDNDNIVVSGLQFSFDNNGTLKEAYSYPSHLRAPAAIRIIGDSSNITIANCKFYHVEAGIIGFPHSTESIENRNSTDPAFMNNILVSDCDIRHADRRGIQFVEQATAKPYDDVEISAGQIGKINILRNNLFDLTSRAEDTKYSDIPAIDVINVERCEIAGNIIDKCKGAGINIRGGSAKKNNTGKNIKMARNFVHHNKVTNTARGLNDYGGIEGWGAGPLYMYNNISGNAVGFKNFMFVNEGSKGRDSFWCTQSPAYYLDGGNKSYLFNNIGWGKKGTMNDKYRNQTGYYAVVGMMNHFFNNTLYNFINNYTGSMGQRASNLGNVNISNGKKFISLNAKGDLGTLGGGTDEGEATSELYTYNFGSSVFHGNPEDGFGNVGREYTKWKKDNNIKNGIEITEEVENVAMYMIETKMNVHSPGIYAKEMPLNDPANHDFRLHSDSDAKEMGVTFFVPWSLSATVGEWNFYRNGFDHTKITGENFFFTQKHLDRSMYNELPLNDLSVPSATEDSYIEGELDSWTKGALVFENNLYATYSHEDMTQSYMTTEDGDGEATYLHSGEDRRTVHIEKQNLLIEIYLKTTGNGVLVSKANANTGYVLELVSGKPSMTIMSDGTECARISSVSINDDQWHHVIAEVDRNQSDGITIYVDGEIANGALSGSMLPIEASLGNTNDFFVGKGSFGNHFTGAIDFLRVCQDTIEASDTTIDELYTWQFNGPHLHDFTGRRPQEGKRDAGALEWGIGLKAVVSTNIVFLPEGSTANFNLRLSVQPENDCTVTVQKMSGDSDISIQNGSSLIFTTNTWNEWQTVTLAASNDVDVVTDTATLQCFISGANPIRVSVETIENDFGVVLSTNALTIAENNKNTFLLKLSMPPAIPVTVNITNTEGDDSISVKTGSSLTFDSSNWSIAQLVTLSAADDPDIVNGTATILCSGSDLIPNSLIVTEEDDDTVAPLTFPKFLEIPEGSNATFAVKLSAIPLNSFTVLVSKVSGDANLSITPNIELTFEPDNWDTNQYVSITASEDPDKKNGDAIFRCSTAFSDITNEYVNIVAIETDKDSEAATFQDGVDGYTGTVDTYLRSGSQSDTNYGTDSSGSLTSRRPLLISWNLDSLSSTNGVDSVTIQLSVEKGSNDARFPLEVYAIKKPWQETNATWNTTDGTTIWQEGGAVGAEDRGILVGTADVPKAVNKTIYSLMINLNTDGLAYVQNAIANPAENYGFHFWKEKGISGTRKCYFREKSDVELRPKLTVYMSEKENFDSDGDGLPDEWEQKHFKNLLVDAESFSSNGINTIRQAYIAGINPTNADSFLTLDSITPLTWNTVSGRVYNIYWTSNLLNGFQLLETNLTDGVFTDATYNAEDKGFYKIEVQLAP